MTKDEFDALAKNIIQTEMDLLDKKRLEYTKTSDILDNFKRLSNNINIDAKKVWAVFFQKHVDSIINFVQSGITHSEPILGRINDARNYLLLLAAIIAPIILLKSVPPPEVLFGIFISKYALPSIAMFLFTRSIATVNCSLYFV